MEGILVSAIYYFSRFLEIMISVRILLSILVNFVGLNRGNPIVIFVYDLTEPILSPVRNALRRSPFGGPGMMIDFSPLIVVFLIAIARTVLINAVVLLFRMF